MLLRRELGHQFDVVVVAVVVLRQGRLLHEDSLLNVYTVRKGIIPRVVLVRGRARPVALLGLGVAGSLLTLARSATVRSLSRASGLSHFTLDVRCAENELVNGAVLLLRSGVGVAANSNLMLSACVFTAGALGGTFKMKLVHMSVLARRGELGKLLGNTNVLHTPVRLFGPGFPVQISGLVELTGVLARHRVHN